MRGNVGDADVVDDALEGVDRVVHLGALVGVGQSMYEIARYVRDNTYATAVFLERLVAREPRPVAPRGRVVDVDLRRGRVRVLTVHGRVAPRAAPGGAAARAQVGVPLPGVRSRAHAGPDDASGSR